MQQVGASKLVDMLDSSDARECLQTLQGIGPTKAERIKRAWDKHRSKLPATVTAPERQPSRAAGSPPPAEAIVWDGHTRCYSPDMYRAETTVANVLARLAAQPPHEPPGTATLSGAERVERWMSTNEKATGPLRCRCKCGTTLFLCQGHRMALNTGMGVAIRTTHCNALFRCKAFGRSASSHSYGCHCACHGPDRRPRLRQDICHGHNRETMEGNADAQRPSISTEFRSLPVCSNRLAVTISMLSCLISPLRSYAGCGSVMLACKCHV